jgi:hypothetical protein
MRTEPTLTRLAAALLVTALVTVAVGCNKTDDPKAAETVILVTGITVAGQSVSSATDTTAHIDYTTNPRNPDPGATSFFHDVTLTSYSVSFEPPVVAPMTGAISTGFCPAAQGACALDLVLVPNGSKPGAGTAVVARIAVEGHDVNENPVNFTASAAISFTP